MVIPGIILSSSHYSFKNDQGQLQEGATIFYILSDTLEPTRQEDERGYKGYAVAKASLTEAAYQNIDLVPGLYHFDIDMRMNRQTMKGEMAIINVSYDQGIETACKFAEATLLKPVKNNVAS